MAPDLARRLYEAESHAIALADGGIARSIFFSLSVAGRQRPDAIGVVLGVSGIPVDLRFAIQDKACRFGQLDRVFLVDVTRRRLRVLLHFGIASMLGHAQDAAGFYIANTTDALLKKKAGKKATLGFNHGTGHGA